jgi:hydroxyethylthiazole kinase-like uncharacterized protein yjeF
MQLTKDSSSAEDWAARFATLMGDPAPGPEDGSKEPEAPPVDPPVDPAPQAILPAPADVPAVVTSAVVGGDEDVGDATDGDDGEDQSGLVLLTPSEMAEADRWAIANGKTGLDLMERAGAAVAAAAQRHVPAGGRVAVLCGPGNNGGDGFVAARLLQEAGYHVGVALVGERGALKGDAATMAERWTGPLAASFRGFADGADLIIDALFGAGLDRPVEGPAAEAIDGANESGIPILSVDLPSGVDGATGAILGRAIVAHETVTFFRRKPAHLLLPGRILAGAVTLADIGIRADCLRVIRPKAFHNDPDLWLPALPVPTPDGHKYRRGHALVVSGPLTGTGAARLAARAALRAGAGLVTLASPADAIVANAAQLTAIMLVRLYEAEGLAEILADRRKNAVVLGPALGVGAPTAALVLAALGSEASVVIDADGLTSFADGPAELFDAVRSRSAPVVLTPHDGEFAKVFPTLAELSSKLERARQAAAQSGAIVVLKGPDTVVAAPEGFAAIADNAPPYLATAGAGDVLAGMIGGLLAQDMPPFEAAIAAVWLHGAAAAAFGPGLISEDLPDTLPRVLSPLLEPARHAALSL